VLLILIPAHTTSLVNIADIALGIQVRTVQSPKRYVRKQLTSITRSTDLLYVSQMRIFSLDFPLLFPLLSALPLFHVPRLPPSFLSLDEVIFFVPSF